MIYIVIGLIICACIIEFSMCYISKISGEQAEQLFNEMMKGKNNRKNGLKETL